MCYVPVSWLVVFVCSACVMCMWYCMYVLVCYCVFGRCSLFRLDTCMLSVITLYVLMFMCVVVYVCMCSCVVFGDLCLC